MHLAAELEERRLPPWPYTTIIGALHHGFLQDDTGARLTPMNASYGLLPPLDRPVRDKKERKLALRVAALADLDLFLRMVQDEQGNADESGD
jgi:methylenetetrahydrofolate--tRNA-(uracil-5-)-methyltransferase